ncbi:MAG: hydrogenase 4 subunit B [Rhodocyclaceae bacterium]
MSVAVNLLIISLACYAAGTVVSLLFTGVEALAIRAAGLAGILGGAAGVMGSVPILVSGSTINFVVDGPFSFAQLAVRIDPLAALMVFVISLVGCASSLYSLSYVREYAGRGAWAIGFFMNVFIGSMVMLVTVDNAFYFIVFFEMMSLASYFLVIFDQDRESVSAGFLYFLIAHAGSVLIMAAFLILFAHSGSLDFESFRQLKLSPALASLVFLLAFFGFGAKAGIVPLHGWLPRAHPAAPSHASAMMSGVMVKIGVFGIVKVGVNLLGASQAWWGILVLAFGAVSALLGVLYALAESDLKRLLAYCTVENVGIILMGVGVGMIGVATGNMTLAVIGLLAGFYHLLNHAVFKGLLFLGVGAVLYRTHTRDMAKLGGLAKRMPWTAGTFLIGSIAICALPPFNGFVSEWFTYQGLFSLGRGGDFAARIAGPVGMVMLALTGALATVCFVKAWGVTFSGLPRSEHADKATEVPWPMVAALVLLAACAVLLGVGASVVAPAMAGVASALANAPSVAVANGAVVFPVSAGQAVLSMPLLTLILIGTLCVPLLLVAALKGARLARRHAGDAWACGYAQEEVMTVSPSGLAQPIQHLFSPLYQLRDVLSPAGATRRAIDWMVGATTRMEPVWDRAVVVRCARAVQWTGRQIQWLQHGDFRVYCLYVVVTLAVLLLVAI